MSRDLLSRRDLDICQRHWPLCKGDGLPHPLCVGFVDGTRLANQVLCICARINNVFCLPCSPCLLCQLCCVTNLFPLIGRTLLAFPLCLREKLRRSSCCNDRRPYRKQYTTTIAYPCRMKPGSVFSNTKNTSCLHVKGKRRPSGYFMQPPCRLK